MMPRCPECEELSAVRRDWTDKCWRCETCGFAWTRPGGMEEIVEVKEDRDE